MGLHVNIPERSHLSSITRSSNPLTTDSDSMSSTNASPRDATSNLPEAHLEQLPDVEDCWTNIMAYTEGAFSGTCPEDETSVCDLATLVRRPPDRNVLFLLGVPDSTPIIIQESSSHVTDPEKLIADVITTVEISLAGLKTLNLDIDLQRFYTGLVNSVRRRRLINSTNLSEDVMGAIRHLLQTSIEERKAREDQIRQRILIEEGTGREEDYRRRVLIEEGMGREEDFRRRILKCSLHSGDDPISVYSSHILLEEQRINDMVKLELARLHATNKDTYTIDSLRDALRAALAARDFCKTISSGHTGSSAETVAFARGD